MKILIIRFSSIGDITQALSIPFAIATKYPDAEIHFLTKSSFKELIQSHPKVKRTWGFEKNKGLKNFFHFINTLNNENYDAIYDAHNNLRSTLFKWLLRAPQKLTKPGQKWKRFLLIQFKINLFEMPFSGQKDLLRPLLKWDIPPNIPEEKQLYLPLQAFEKTKSLKLNLNIPPSYIVLAPSAAHPFKRWPLYKWIELIESYPDQNFIILAGPTDTFTSELNLGPNVFNLTGLTDLIESAAILAEAQIVIANDTGLLHFAEQLNKTTIALMGAAPFGFPPKKSTTIIHKKLPCWPCSKHGQGPCLNKNYHQCMTDISVDEVSLILDQQLEKLC